MGRNFCVDLTMHVPTTEKKIEIVEFGFKFYDINITILLYTEWGRNTAQNKWQMDKIKIFIWQLYIRRRFFFLATIIYFCNCPFW